MAWQEPQHQRVTVEEWRAIIERSGIRYEYHDGYLVAMSGGTLDHTQIGFNAVAALRTVLSAGSCRAYGSYAVVRFLPTAYRFCDAVVTCDPRIGAIRGKSKRPGSSWKHSRHPHRETTVRRNSPWCDPVPACRSTCWFGLATSVLRCIDAPSRR